MGYNLYITRAEHWVDSKQQPITLDEWIAYVENDPDMRLDNHAVAVVDGKPVLTYENEGLSVWTAYSKHNEQGNMAWFDYHRGDITVKNPDEEILKKMKQVALHFQANLIGDDGESY